MKYFEFPANPLWPNGKILENLKLKDFFHISKETNLFFNKCTKFLPFGHNRLAGNSKGYNFDHLARNLI